MAGIVHNQETIGTIIVLDMVRDRGVEVVLRLLCS